LGREEKRVEKARAAGKLFAFGKKKKGRETPVTATLAVTATSKKGGEGGKGGGIRIGQDNWVCTVLPPIYFNRERGGEEGETAW